MTPVLTNDLHQGASGHAPMSPRAERLLKSQGRRANERDYLTALLAEPSGTVREVLGSAGVDVDALTRGVAGSALDWRTPAPRRVVSSTPPLRGRRVSSLRLEHWICAPHPLVHLAAADLEGTDRWLTSPDDRQRVVDGRRESRVESGQAGGSVDLVLTAATPERVRWEMWWGERYGGSHTLDLRPLEGGTLVALTREITTFGRLAAVAMPAVRLAIGLGIVHDDPEPVLRLRGPRRGGTGVNRGRVVMCRADVWWVPAIGSAQRSTDRDRFACSGVSLCLSILPSRWVLLSWPSAPAVCARPTGPDAAAR